MIKKLASHLGEYKRAAILTPMFSALEAVMDILLPTIMAFIIDLGIEKGDMNAIVKYGLLTFAVAAIALLLGVLAGKYAAEASTGFAGNLRDAMYENIQHYSFSNIDKFSTAGLVTRMTTDVTRSTVTNILQLMERKGYITRQSVEQDARLKQLVLTEKGRQFHEDTMRAFHQTDEYVAGLLTEEENTELLRLLNKLYLGLK